MLIRHQIYSKNYYFVLLIYLWLRGLLIYTTVFTECAFNNSTREPLSLNASMNLKYDKLFQIIPSVSPSSQILQTSEIGYLCLLSKCYFHPTIRQTHYWSRMWTNTLETNFIQKWRAEATGRWILFILGYFFTEDCREWNFFVGGIIIDRKSPITIGTKTDSRDGGKLQHCAGYIHLCALLFMSNFRVSLTNEWAPRDGKVTNGVKQVPLQARLQLCTRQCTLALTTKTVLTDYSFLRYLSDLWAIWTWSRKLHRFIVRRCRDNRIIRPIRTI